MGGNCRLKRRNIIDILLSEGLPLQKSELNCDWGWLNMCEYDFPPFFEVWADILQTKQETGWVRFRVSTSIVKEPHFGRSG